MKELLFIASVIKEANDHIQQFSIIEDGGTCNMDCVVLSSNGYRQSEINKISTLSGVSIGEKLTSRYWKGDRFINFDVCGQGNRRTKMVEEANKYLKEKGIKTSVYYQMD